MGVGRKIARRTLWGVGFAALLALTAGPSSVRTGSLALSDARARSSWPDRAHGTAAPTAVGAVLAWGCGGAANYGQCTVPAAASSGVSTVAAGASHSLALKSGGVVAWGCGGGNDYGQCAVPAAASSGVTAIAAGAFHSLALKNGGVLAWGCTGTNYGQCTVPAGAGSGVTAIAAGAFHSVALKNDGSVLAWGCLGALNYGQCMVPASGTSGVAAISAGQYQSLALKSGSVLAWGCGSPNNFGQCTVPAGATSGVGALAAGSYHSLALKSGAVIAWGCGGSFDYGQCTVPGAASSVTAIAANGYHSLALKSDGYVVAWGCGNAQGVDWGQCTVPGDATRAIAIAAGAHHSLAVNGPVPAVTMYLVGVDTANNGPYLIKLDTATGTFLAAPLITGLAPGEDIGSIDCRPATGQIYGLGDSATTARLYRIDAVTGAATQIGSTFDLAGSGGFDFDPVTDLVRVAGPAVNVRLSPVGGTQPFATDSPLAYAAGDPNAGQTASVGEIAYSNNVSGAGSTTLYGIDGGTNGNQPRLVSIAPQNAGTTHTIGSLGAAYYPSSFDIAPNGTPFALLHIFRPPPTYVEYDLFTINLTTGAATFYQPIFPDYVPSGITVACGSPPTAVRLARFSARRAPDGYELSWRTGNESRIIGFNLYRHTDNRLVRLNRRLIRSVVGGTTSGRSYSYVDRTRLRGSLSYELQAVHLDGTRFWLGSVSTRLR